MKVYTVMVQKPRGLPGFLARASLEILPGLKGWRPEESDDGKTSAMTLIFATVPHAEKATARLFARGWRVGEYVMNADIDLKAQRLYVHDPVGGWESVDPARVEYDENGKPKHCWDYLRSKREAEWPEGKAVPDELKRNLNSGRAGKTGARWAARPGRPKASRAAWPGRRAHGGRRGQEDRRRAGQRGRGKRQR